MSLAEKIRKARESKVKVGEFTYWIRRPTDLEAMGFAKKQGLQDFMPFIFGWEGIKEIDLFEGGAPTPAAFESDACFEFLSDRPADISALLEAIVKSYEAYRNKLDADKKK